MFFDKQNIKQHGEVYTVEFSKTKLSIIPSGVGCPATSLKLEALRSLKIQAIIRFDFCGSLTDDVEIGDIVIVTKAICGDGTTQQYWNFEQDALV